MRMSMGSDYAILDNVTVQGMEIDTSVLLYGKFRAMDLINPTSKLVN